MKLQWTLILTAVIGAGCRTAPPAPQHHPVFPSPPATARVIHRADVRGPAHLARPSLLDRIIGAAVGRDNQVIQRPTAVAYDGQRRLYISDMERQTVHVLDQQSGRGAVITRAGKEYLVSPAGLAVMDGQLVVADSALARVFFFDADRRLVASIDDVQRPTGLHYDAPRGELYVVDTLAHQVRVYDGKRQLQRSFGEPGIGPGQFNFPTHVFVDRAGRAYVTDSLNFRVQVFDAAGRYQTHIGQLGDASGFLAMPKGVVVDSFGHIYIADSYFSNIQVYDAQGRFLLAIGAPGEDSGQFHLPVGMCIDAEDRFYVTDSYNSRVQIFQYIGGSTHDEP